LSNDLRRIYDISIEFIEDGIKKTRKLELKNWSNFYPETIQNQFIKDLAKMENLGEIQWIFNKTSGISDIGILKGKVISALKKADGSAVDELKAISESQIKKLFPEDIRFIDNNNRIEFLLDKLEDNNIFDKIFEVAE
jgi:hypothetical protein